MMRQKELAKPKKQIQSITTMKHATGNVAIPPTLPFFKVDK